MNRKIDWESIDQELGLKEKPKPVDWNAVDIQLGLIKPTGPVGPAAAAQITFEASKAGITGLAKFGASLPSVAGGLMMEAGETAEEGPDYFDELAAQMTLGGPLVKYGKKSISFFAKRTQLDEQIAESGKKIIQSNQKYLAKHFPGQDTKTKQFFEDLGAGAGSLGLALGLAYLTRSPEIASIAFGTIQKAQTYPEARGKGKTPTEASRISTLAGAAEGALEKIGLDFLLTKFGGPIKTALIHMTSEAMQEASQSLAESGILTGTGVREFKGIKPIIQQAAYEGLIGALLGGMASPITQQIPFKNAGIDEVTAKRVTEKITETAKQNAAQISQLLTQQDLDTIAQDVDEYSRNKYIQWWHDTLGGIEAVRQGPRGKEQVLKALEKEEIEGLEKKSEIEKVIDVLNQAKVLKEAPTAEEQKKNDYIQWWVDQLEDAEKVRKSSEGREEVLKILEQEELEGLEKVPEVDRLIGTLKEAIKKKEVETPKTVRIVKSETKPEITPEEEPAIEEELPSHVRTKMRLHKLVYMGRNKRGYYLFRVPSVKDPLMVDPEDLANYTSFSLALKDHLILNKRTGMAKKVRITPPRKPPIMGAPKRKRPIHIPRGQLARYRAEIEPLEKFEIQEIPAGAIAEHGVGAKFTIKGEEYEVKRADSGNILIEDGERYEVDEFDKIPVDRGEIKAGPLKPKPVEKVHPLPIRPPSNRWSSDRGAVPGEPVMWLDSETAEEAKAAIIEDEDDQGYVLYRLIDNQGEILGEYETVEQATEAGEGQFPAEVEVPTEKVQGGAHEQITEPSLKGQAHLPKGKIRVTGPIKPVEGGEGVGFFKAEEGEQGKLFEGSFRYGEGPSEISITETEAAYGTKEIEEKAISQVSEELQRGSRGQSQLSGTLRQKKRIDYRGTKVGRDPRKIAELWKVFRNPDIEHLHAIYVKNGIIVAHNAITSGAPNYVQMGYKLQYQIRSAADRLKADSVYLIHNHPSGNPKPSRDDINFMRIIKYGWTGKVLPVIPQLKAGIVMDHDRFTIIKPAKNTYELTTEFFQVPGTDYTRFRGAELNEPAKIAHHVKSLDKGKLVLIFVDNAYRIKGMEVVRRDSNLKQVAKQGKDRFRSAFYFIVGDGAIKSSKDKVIPGIVDIVEPSSDPKQFYNSAHELGESLGPEEEELRKGRMLFEQGGGYGKIEISEPQPKSAGQSRPVHQVSKDIDQNGLVTALDDMKKIIMPAKRSDISRFGARIIRKNIAQMVQREDVRVQKLREGSRQFAFMSREDAVEFIDRMEAGEAQETEKLDAIALKIREILDTLRTEIQALGKGYLEKYYENYFPHIWKNPKKAQFVISSMMNKRPLRGPRSFLKQRSIITVKQGIEAGLEPVSWNPIDLVLLKAHEMERFLMAHRLIRDMKNRGVIRFKYVKAPMPEGHTYINDVAFTVFMPPEIRIPEAYDQLLVDNLMDIAKSLGIDAKRLMKLKMKAWGYAQGKERVRTKFGGPESVLAHEIGHILGNRYNLYEWIVNPPGKIYKGGKKKGLENIADKARNRKLINDQLRALADMRYQTIQAPESYKQYVRKAEEKEAVMLEALIHAPEEFKKIAPDLYARFTQFLNDHAELRPILDIKPSLVLGSQEGTVKVPGVTELGRYVAPEHIARLLNNYLSPGLRRADNALIAGTYDLTRQVANAMNYVNLSLSFFHGLNTGTDILASQLGLGLRQVLATPGQRMEGLKKIISTPISPITSLWKGHKLDKELQKDIKDITDPNMRKMVLAVVMAGGRRQMDIFYHNQAVRALTKSIQQIRYGSFGEKMKGSMMLPFNLIGSGIEIITEPLMEFYVPRIKLGSFMLLAQHEMERRRTGQIDDQQLWERLVESWDSVDNRMGQLVYDNLFWNKTLKDSLMLAIRSVGWNLGSWREYAGAPVDLFTTGKRIKSGDVWLSDKMAYVTGAAIIYSVLGAVLTYLLTGKRPEELKDYFFPKTGHKNPDGSDQRLNLPTYAKDWYAYSQRPMSTLANKLNPIWTTLYYTWSNKDFFGTEIRHQDDPLIKQLLQVAEYWGDSFLPFSVQNYNKMRKEGDQLIKSMAVSATGITSAPSYVTRSPAQKRMIEHIVESMPRGARTKEQYERSLRRKKLVYMARIGHDVMTHPLAKGLTPTQIKGIIRESKLEPFAAQFKRLNLKDALNVYSIASEEERKQVLAILKDKFARSTTYKNDPEIRKLYLELVKPEQRMIRIKR